MDKKWKLGVLGGAGLVVATLAAVGSAAFGGTPQERDTVPAGQVVVDRVVRDSEPASTTAGTASVDASTTTLVPAATPRQQPTTQPRAVNNEPVTTPQQPAPTTTTSDVPRDENGAPLNPTPGPPAPPVGNPPGMSPIPDPTTPAP